VTLFEKKQETPTAPRTWVNLDSIEQLEYQKDPAMLSKSESTHKLTIRFVNSKPILLTDKSEIKEFTKALGCPDLISDLD